MTKPSPQVPRLIPVDVFNMDVAVFSTDQSRGATLRSEGCDADEWTEAALASAHRDETTDGYPRFSFVIKSDATQATWAHECSHMADFMCETLGIPICMETTEVRAYLIGHFMAHLGEILTPEDTK